MRTSRPDPCCRVPRICPIRAPRRTATGARADRSAHRVARVVPDVAGQLREGIVAGAPDENREDQRGGPPRILGSFGMVSAIATPAASASAGAAWTKYCGRLRLPLIAIDPHASATHATGTRTARFQIAATQQHRAADPADEPQRVHPRVLDGEHHQVTRHVDRAAIGLAGVVQVVGDGGLVNIRRARRRARTPPRARPE